MTRLHDAAKIIDGRLKSRGFDVQCFSRSGHVFGIGMKFYTNEGAQYWAVVTKEEILDRDIKAIESLMADHLNGLANNGP